MFVNNDEMLCRKKKILKSHTTVVPKLSGTAPKRLKIISMAIKIRDKEFCKQAQEQFNNIFMV